MKHTIPLPIQKTLIKTILLGCAVMLFGLIWGLASRDYGLLFLSAAVGALGGLKILSLYRLAIQQHYEVCEGIVLADRAIPLRNRHMLIMTDESQREIRIALSGKATLKTGVAYRLYISGRDDDAVLNYLPEQLMPARTLIGHELLEEQATE